ncbi:c-type cytochrome [Nafulsella turpanensis]|uniref:c-type cytochrome n=1 Tax=Nafulsella turpanensis TaxID=1265690 RepID=UPI00037A7B2B|nr:cytochrome c [Nafulsella turpanensis]
MNKLKLRPLLLLFTLPLLLNCQGQEQPAEGSFTVPEELDSKAALKFRQYAVQGQILYQQHCTNCHQQDGSGLGELIPPLAQSDFLLNNKGHALCIIRHGMEGPVVVNGVQYNQPMPANPALTDIEIAEIATYILNSWGNEGGFVSVQEAEERLNQCK